MKIILLILFVVTSGNGFSQNNSDLYIYVDSLIQFQIQYEFDTSTNQLPNYKWDSTKIAIPDFSTFPANPSPLMILDGKKINMDELNLYNLRQIASIDIYKKDDKKMLAIYGSSSKNGAIIIRSKRFKRKGKFKD